MKTFIALLRGINVGGNNVLPMRDFVGLLESLGSRDVKTYIQSGNAVFSHKENNAAALANRIRAKIKQGHGFEPHVLLLALKDMQKAIAENPFPEAEAEPKSLHLFFLDSTPSNPDLKTLESIQRDSERFRLTDTVFYLHAPDGIGKSKLAARVEKSLGFFQRGDGFIHIAFL